LQHEPWKIEGQRWIEFPLSAPFHGFRLAAQYDLLVLSPDGRITILDWKTSRKKPKRENLAAQLQTRVYRLMAVLAGKRLAQGGEVDPARVEMQYWYPEAPQRPETFGYSADQFKLDGAYLAGLIDQILAAEGDLPLTARIETCRFCVYRSLCERGVSAGSLDDLDEEPDEHESLDIDYEQIGEVAF
jgi:RecB family exonuclease